VGVRLTAPAVANKYKLCQTASKATRRLHLSSKNTTDTINSAFGRIADDLIEPVTVVVLPILPVILASQMKD
jgi:hypothetical protein